MRNALVQFELLGVLFIFIIIIIIIIFTKYKTTFTNFGDGFLTPKREGKSPYTHVSLNLTKVFWISLRRVT